MSKCLVTDPVIFDLLDRPSTGLFNILKELWHFIVYTSQNKYYRIFVRKVCRIILLFNQQKLTCSSVTLE